LLYIFCGKQLLINNDYLGRLIKVIEQADVDDYITTYEYNAAGDLVQVRDHYGNTTVMDYDTLGRKINMTDPDMGYWQYWYDENDNLIHIINFKRVVFPAPEWPVKKTISPLRICIFTCCNAS